MIRFPPIPGAQAALLATIALIGCEPASSEPRPVATAPTVESRKPLLWKHIERATVVVVSDAVAEDELRQASVEARKTLDDARHRWSVATPAERTLWAVKWAAPRGAILVSEVAANRAAPVDHGDVEHVWVQPVTWSAFRIEGVLLSAPATQLESRKTRGEAVSFPVEEVSDWIHFATDAADAAFEGGYTVRVLEKKYGKPGM